MRTRQQPARGHTPRQRAARCDGTGQLTDSTDSLLSGRGRETEPRTAWPGSAPGRQHIDSGRFTAASRRFKRVELARKISRCSLSMSIDGNHTCLIAAALDGVGLGYHHIRASRIPTAALLSVNAHHSACSVGFGGVWESPSARTGSAAAVGGLPARFVAQQVFGEDLILNLQTTILASAASAVWTVPA